MKGWILYKRNLNELTDQDHGVNRFLESAAEFGMEIDVFNPEQFEYTSRFKDGEIGFKGRAQPLLLPDFVIPRMGADTNLYGFALIRQLENQGVLAVNSAEAIATVKDKMKVCQLLQANHLPCPKTMLLQLPPDMSVVEREIGFPLVIKTLAGAKGMGVHLCETAESFENMMGLFDRTCHPELIIQPFIKSSFGRDLRVFVVGSEVVGCMQRTAKSGFKANFSLGAEVASFPITEEIKNYALESARITGLEIAGIDLLFGEEGFLVCEANSAPGFKGLEQATGENVAGRIFKYISNIKKL